jgi:hypothetical protein
MINQFKKIDEIEMFQKNVSKIVHYNTCAISENASFDSTNIVNESD